MLGSPILFPLLSGLCFVPPSSTLDFVNFTSITSLQAQPSSPVPEHPQLRRRALSRLQGYVHE